jgi:hypothetical protein
MQAEGDDMPRARAGTGRQAARPARALRPHRAQRRAAPAGRRLEQVGKI